MIKLQEEEIIISNVIYSSFFYTYKAYRSSFVWIIVLFSPCIFKKDFIYFKRGREGERERDIVWLPLTCPLLETWPDLAPNLGMCPDWESNQWPFGLQVGVQSTDPHQPGLHAYV